MCYSSLDNGNGYRGSSTNGSCVSWSQNASLPVPENAAAGLGDHSYCRNPYPQTRPKPWCYESDGGIRDCAIDKCTKGTPQIFILYLRFINAVLALQMFPL